MKPQKTRIILIVLLIVLVLAGSGLGQAQSQPVFRIGVLDEERGPITNAARLAIQEINDSGGVIGADGTAFQLQLVIEPTDGGARLTEAANAINQSSVIAVLGPVTTEEVLSGMSTLQGLNVPVLTPAAGDTIIASDASRRIFRLRAPEALQGQALARYLVNDLGLHGIVTVQMDLTSTAAVVGFSTAIAGLGVPPQNAVLYQSGMDMAQVANAIMAQNPEIAVLFGPTNVAAELFITLRASGWNGMVAYNQADNAAFRESVPLSQIAGILGGTSWPYSARDTVSDAFLNNFVRAAGYVPGPIEAASYDGVNLLAAAIGLPGDLLTNLAQLDNIEGAQGLLTPAQLNHGEISNNTAVVKLGPLGGAQIVARYFGGQRLTGDQDTAVPTSAPKPTATPEGVVATIKSAYQNVRNGPGLVYDVIGQIQRDTQVRVIGANLDFSWLVIEYRGQNGWLSRSILDVFGDLSTLSLISPPPTPTPGPPTATPTAQPYPDIIILDAAPSVLTVGVPFTISVTVRNQGLADAGPFAVASTFMPDSIYNGVNLASLGAGQQTVVNLTGTLNGATGIYKVVVVADLNQQVDEGPTGEANNGNYNFTYRLDRPVLNSGTLTLNPGGSLSLEGAGLADVQWNATGTSLDFPAPPAGSGMYIMSGVGTFNDVYYDLINTSLTNTYNLNVALLPNAYIGIVTAEGNRGVMHVDSVVSGGQITLSYRVYAP
jgi:ABC-type branched-subunit amino acid transport system substrate-binding protein